MCTRRLWPHQEAASAPLPDWFMNSPSLPPLCARGRCLMDIELLSSGGVATCVYATSPEYINAMCALFPSTHFYVCVPDYTPELPEAELLYSKGNLTVSNVPFNKEFARGLGQRGPASVMALIIHDSVAYSPENVVLLHALACPNVALVTCSLLPAPEHFLHGEITLPPYNDWCSARVYLTVTGAARAVPVDGQRWKAQLAAFHLSGWQQQYDLDAEDTILFRYSHTYIEAAEYARGRIPPKLECHTRSPSSSAMPVLQARVPCPFSKLECHARSPSSSASSALQPEFL